MNTLMTNEYWKIDTYVTEFYYRFVRIMQFFSTQLKDNWEPSVGEVKLWEYLMSLLRWLYGSLIVGILYRYDMITKCFHLNEIIMINFLCISLLVGICWELQPARAFSFHAPAWIVVLVHIFNPCFCHEDPPSFLSYFLWGKNIL